MRAWWGRLSLRARLAFAFGAMAAAALVFLLAIVARTLGPASLSQGKIIPAGIFVLGVFFLGGWFVAEWCLREIGKLGAKARGAPAMALPAELEGLAALLRHEAERHDRLLEELRRFTADAAHELRTPLTAMRTTGEVALLGRADTPVLREALGTILEETQRMSGLIDRLLRLARLESDTLTLNLRTLDLGEHLAAWRDSLLILADEKQQKIELTCPKPIRVVSDADLLGHALVNVLHNAISHSPPGSTIRIIARTEAITENVAIDIADEGPGIAPEHQSRIFERFYRIGPDRAREGGGAGLGLCIALTVMKRLSGKITLSSESGHGACFTLHLPRDASDLRA